MEAKDYKLKILGNFFENPEKNFQIREISKLTKINHTTVRKHLNKLVEEEYLKTNEERIYISYCSNINKKYLNLKLFYNLENLRKSKLIEFLEKEFDLPTIVLFGSFAKGENSIESDIDLTIISEINKEINIEEYEKKLNKKIEIHLLNRKKINSMKEKNLHLLNSICNGIILSGELELI